MNDILAQTAPAQWTASPFGYLAVGAFTGLMISLSWHYIIFYVSPLKWWRELFK